MNGFELVGLLVVAMLMLAFVSFCLVVAYDAISRRHQ